MHHGVSQGYVQSDSTVQIHKGTKEFLGIWAYSRLKNRNFGPILGLKFQYRYVLQRGPFFPRPKEWALPSRLDDSIFEQ